MILREHARLLMLLGLACAPAPSPRALHVVDGEVVASEPVAPWAYATYLRARLAMEASPPRLDEARMHLSILLEREREDPHLWTTLAELEVLDGHPEAATAALDRALALAPGYPGALAVQARLASAGAAQ